MSEVPQSIQDSQVLRGLTPVQLQDLVSLASFVEVPSGRVIFSAGDPGDALYVLAAGRVRILSESEVIDHEVDALSEGQAFGIRALLTGEPRSASAVADADCRLFRIDRHAWVELVESRDPTAATLLHNLARLLCARSTR